MAAYGQFCPIAVATEVLAERWTVLVIRELLYGSRRFNDLRRGLPLMSPSMLSKRLKSLERAGLVTRRVDADRGVEYVPTDATEELRPLLGAIADWGLRWSRSLLETHNLDASFLMWDVRRKIVPEALPPQRVVAEFRLRGASRGKHRYWLVLHGGDADLCLVDPGFEVDVVVDAHVRTLVAYWLEKVELADAVRTGEVQLAGPRHLLRGFPTWFHRCGVAAYEPPGRLASGDARGRARRTAPADEPMAT
jgi:DNA-binding HxlR family transcriptional regulator